MRLTSRPPADIIACRLLGFRLAEVIPSLQQRISNTALEDVASEHCRRMTAGASPPAHHWKLLLATVDLCDVRALVIGMAAD